MSSDRCHVRFPCDENGKVLQPTETGGTNQKLGTETTFKYTKDAQFCHGVAKVCIVNVEGEEFYEGPRCKTFNYMGKCILSISDYKKVDDEIRRVKNLKSKLPPWYVDSHPPNLMWDEDPVEKIPGVGENMAASLHAITVDIINDVKSLSIIELQDISIN